MLHIRNLFRSFINQQHYHLYVGIALLNCRRHFFEKMHLHPVAFLCGAMAIAAAATVLSLYTLGAQVFLGYKGYKVVQAEDGTVTGVIVYDADADRYVKFNCKAVISCAGGYNQNADMCWALLNEL